MSSIQLSVVIPAFNEAGRIGKTLDLLYRELRSTYIDAEVIVIDDGSTDGTASYVENLSLQNLRVIRNEKNRGKGYSVYRGFGEALGKYILLMDADGSTDIKCLRSFFDMIDGHFSDVVIGSRAVNDSVIIVPQPFFRRVMGVCFRLMIKAMFLFPWNDTQCGFKMLTTRAAKFILPKCKESGFAFDVEMLYWLKKSGYRIMEKGVRWDNDDDSKVTIFKGPIKMFIAILKLRFATL